MRRIALLWFGTAVALVGVGCKAPPTSSNGGDASASLGAAVEQESTAARPSVDRFKSVQRTALDFGQPRPDARHVQPKTVSTSVLPASAADHFEREGDVLRPVIRAEEKTGSVNHGDVSYPATADGTFRVRELISAMQIDVALDGLLAVPAEVSQGYVLYRGALTIDDGRSGRPILRADVLNRPTATGTEDYVYFERPPSQNELTYNVTLGTRVAGLRLVENVLEFVDTKGTPRLRIESPYLVGNDGAHVRADITVVGCDVDTSPVGPWGRAVTPPNAHTVSQNGAATCAVKMSWGGAPVSYPAVFDPMWTQTGSMVTFNSENKPNRQSFTLNVLPAGGAMAGKALAAGGEDRYRDNEGGAEAELYDPVSATWTPTGSMTYRRADHSGKVLTAGPNSGKVIVFGGMDQMSGMAQLHMMGGNPPTTTIDYHNNTSLFTTEIYDPSTGKWTLGPNLNEGRAFQRSVILPSSDIVTCGGTIDYDTYYLNSAEVYSALNNTWTKVQSMVHPREGHTANLVMMNGLPKVIVSSGYNANPTEINPTLNSGGEGYLTSSEIYDPVAQTWSAGPAVLPDPNGIGRWTSSFTNLGDGTVLIAGGYNDNCSPNNCNGNSVGFYLSSAEIYDPNANTWTNVGSMSQVRYAHTATVGPCGGDVLVAGGYSGTNYLTSCELYDPLAKAWRSTASLNIARAYHSAVVLSNNGTSEILAAGGATAVMMGDMDQSTQSCELYTGFGGAGCNCTVDIDCLTGHCVAGVCCNTACGNSCEACNLPGNVGTCLPRPAQDPGSPSCGTYVCDGTSHDCPTQCANNTVCSATNFCNCGHQCGGKQANGACCTNATMCLSGFCVDGVCCSSSCSDGCDVCSAALGAIADGTCTTVRKGTVGMNPSCGNYLCDGVDATCPTTCKVETDCANGDVCDCTGHCVPPLANGQCCTRATECASAECFSGVCCATACGGACATCNLNAQTAGTCQPEPKGNTGSPSCAPTVCDGVNLNCPNGCVVNTDCKGAANYVCGCIPAGASTGACVPIQANGACCTRSDQCASGNCADGFCCDAACTGGCDVCAATLGATQNGHCTVVGRGTVGMNPSCGNYFCDGTNASCPTGCTVDSDCTNSTICSCAGVTAGMCIPPQAPGACCTRGTQCASGFCADGVCCDQACTGACQVCQTAHGATANGTCTDLPAGTSVAACLPGTCSGGPGCNKACDLTATPPQTCAAGNFCTCTNQCVLLNTLPLGACCTDGAGGTASTQCASKFCVDGVCCNNACNGACSACNLAGTSGTCSFSAKGSPGTPVCGAYVCNGQLGTCPTSCNVDSDCAAGFLCGCGSGGIRSCIPANSIADGLCCTENTQCLHNNCVGGICCNTACGGACQTCTTGACTVDAKGAPGTPSCAPYACDGTHGTCPTTCVTNADCTNGDICGCNGVCEALLGLGATCCNANGSQCQSGNCVDGVCCDVACTGQCASCAILGHVGTCTVDIKGDSGRGGCGVYKCDGISQNCPSSCLVDNDCTAPNVCTCVGPGQPQGVCGPKEPNGQCCTSGTQCQSGNCVDGFCCNTGCVGNCQVCSASLGASSNGTCTVLVQGSSGRPSCGNYVCNGTSPLCPPACVTSRDCAVGYICACDGTCQPKLQLGAKCCDPTGAQCASGFCAIAAGQTAGVCCNQACSGGCATCSLPGAEGQCRPLAAGVMGVGCGPYLCDGDSIPCPRLCEKDADCSGGDVCSCAGQCVPPQVNGACCATNTECSSGFCVDNVCCNTACIGACNVCNLAASAGTCTPAPKGSFGHPSCAPFVCDGTDTDCPTTCSAQNDTCLPGLSANDPSNVCCGGTCLLPQANGQTCMAGCECTSGNCVDGYCCDTQCDGQCQACNVKGTEGTCSNVAGAPVGSRAPCSSGDGGSTACAGTCNGMSPTCTFPPVTTQCAPAACTNGTVAAASFCDGQGGCKSGATTPCPAGCNGTMCAVPPDMTVVPPDLQTPTGRLTGGGRACRISDSRSSAANNGGVWLSVAFGALLLIRRRRRATRG